MEFQADNEVRSSPINMLAGCSKESPSNNELLSETHRSLAKLKCHIQEPTAYDKEIFSKIRKLEGHLLNSSSLYVSGLDTRHIKACLQKMSHAAMKREHQLLCSEASGLSDYCMALSLAIQ